MLCKQSSKETLLYSNIIYCTTSPTILFTYMSPYQFIVSPQYVYKDCVQRVELIDRENLSAT